ncbi:MAG: hypothetical protein KGY76_02770 [Candidatus Thermoplasmatota archaeon]|nr:hypothetical protein [Candidatus Thermoplasmatota archaeon]
MAISMDWSKISILSVVAFAVGWWLLGLLWAVVIAIVFLILSGALSLK